MVVVEQPRVFFEGRIETTHLAFTNHCWSRYERR